MNRLLKFLIGLALLPFAFAFIFNFMAVVWEIVKNFNLTFPFLTGFALYCFLHRYVYNFSRPYVLAHETSHAFAALCCGYKVSDIKVKEESGHTKVSDFNTFVLLAPYCLPLYAVISIIVFYITSLFWKDILAYNTIFLGVLGFFMALHLVHTFKTLTETKQSDISLAGGGVFSFVLIAVINLSLLILLINFLFPTLVAPMPLLKEVIAQTILFWKLFFIYLHKGIVWIFDL